jgi:hypothetical protein
VLDAYEKVWSQGYGSPLAAALRAAADQIQFEEQLGMTAYGGCAQAQSQLLAIAAELVDPNPTREENLD